MTELSGTLEGVGLPAIVRFLTGLGKTGRLRITTEQWHGEVYFDHGRLTDASLGSRRGVAALEGLIQALPGAEFAFDADATPAQASAIDVDQPGLLNHLDELGASAANGSPTVPAIHMVPRVVRQSGGADEPLALDRRALQTLLAVDGARTVNDILIQRGSIDALWDLADLGRAGLIRFDRGGATSEPPAVADRNGVPQAAVEHGDTARLKSPAEPVAQCPKLGFEDDPSNSFNRPTRLHRCFALEAPLPLTLDEQSELCLTDHFQSCPRFAAAQEAAAGAAPARPMPVAPAPTEDHPEGNGHVVRLPFGGRPRMPGHVAPAPPETSAPSPSATPAPPETSAPSPTAAPAPPETSAPSPSTAPASPESWQPSPSAAPGRFLRPTSTPTPSEVAARTVPPESQPTARKRLINPAAAGTATPTVPASPGPPELPQSLPPPAEPPRAETTLDRGLVFGMPVQLLVMGIVAVVVLAIVAYLLVGPNLGGQPTIQVTAAPTSAPNAGAQVGGTLPAQAPPVRAPATSAPAAAPTVAAAPTTAPAAAPATAAVQPTVAVQPTPSLSPTPSGPQTVFEERFTSNARNWPSDPQGPAVLTNGVYQISTRQPGQFVAIAAPVPNIFDQVIVTARFHKLGGPPGGGYGVIIRDQGPGPRDGLNQSGNYYVAEIGDKGEVGMWRRDGNTWVDLLPWQPSAAVRADTGANDLSLRGLGDRLTMIVNGNQVASVTDNVLPTGAVGVFVGGDGNQVALEQYAVQTP